MKNPEKKGLAHYHINGMMKSAQYIDVMEKTLIPNMQKVSPHGSVVCQQDLAPCHTSKMVNTVLANKNKIKLWLGSSLQLNLPENLWFIIKSYLRKKNCTMKAKLIETIIQLQ